MSETAEKEKAKLTIGCAGIVAHFPAMVVWWVLFGVMLHKTQAGTMEWSLYVGYLVCSVISFVLFSVVKLLE